MHMPKGANQKFKLYYLMKIMLEKDRRRVQHHNAGDINRVGEIPSLSRAEKHLRRLAGSGKVV